MRRLVLALLVLVALGLAVYRLRPAETPEEGQREPPVEVEKDGDGDATVPPVVLRGDATAAPSKVAGGRSVRGVVLDREGGAVPDVLVVVGRVRPRTLTRRLVEAEKPGGPDERVAASTRSDPQGRFAIENLPSGSDVGLWIRAVPEPPAIGSGASLPGGGWTAADVSLQVTDGVPLALRVVDAGGRGVVARVEARSSSAFKRSLGMPGTWFSRTSWTNADGRLVLPAVPVGLLRVNVRVPERIEIRGLRVPAPSEDEHVIRLPGDGPCTLEGRVTNAIGAGVAAARIVATVTRPPGSEAREITRVTTTKAEGRYVFGGLTSGALTRLEVDADGYQPRSFEDLRWSLDPAKPLVFDITLARGGTITGRVLGPEGQGLAGASVEVRVRSRRMATHACVSGREGHYLLRGVPPGEHVLAASKDGYYAESAVVGFGASRRDRLLRSVRGGALVTLEDDGGTAHHDFTLRPGIPVAGVVLDEAGAPVVGARVVVGAQAAVTDLPPMSWITFGSGATGTTTTGEDGRFAFAGLRPGARPVFLEARRKGLVTDALEIVIREDDAEALGSLELRAHPTATLGGLVVDADEHPVGGVLVWLPPSTNLRADGTGRFRFTGLRAGTYTLRVNGRPQGPEVTRSVARGETVDDVVLRAPETSTVQGILVDDAGEPQPFTRIDFERDGDVRGRTAAWTITDAQGAFLVGGLPDGTYRVRTADDQVAALVEAGSAGLRLVRPRLVERGVHLVHGEVRAPDGSPLPLGKVHILFASDTRPDGTTSRTAGIVNGRFRLEIRTNATAVDLRVSDAADALGRPVIHEPVRLEDLPIGGSPFVIELTAPGVVAGRVVDETGDGVDGIVVTARHGPRRGRSERSRSEATSRTDADGAFLLEELNRGAVTLSVSAPRTFYAVPPLSVETGDEDVVIRLQRAAAIAGRVVGEDGEPLGDVPIQAMPATHPRGNWGQARSAKDGSFLLEGIDRDTTYTVRTNFDPDGKYPTLVRCLVEDVRPGATDVVLVARLGVFVEGVVLFPDGSPAVGGSVIARPTDGRTDTEGLGHGRVETPGGTFRLGPIVPGRYKLLAHPPAPEFGASEPIEVDVPCEAVRLILTGKRTRHGRVLVENLTGFQVASIAPVEGGGHRLIGRSNVSADGSFVLAFPDDEPLTVVLYGHDDDRYALLHDVRPVAEWLEVSLVAGLDIAGRLDPFVGGRRSMKIVYAESVAYGFRKSVRVDEQGNFRIRGLPPGDYILTLFPFRGEGEAPRTTAAAGSSDVVLEMPQESR